MTEYRREQSFGILARQRECISVANAGRDEPDQHLAGPRSVVIVGPAGNEATQALAQAARRTYVPGAIVVTLDPTNESDAKTLKALGQGPAEKPTAYICRAGTCLAPATTPEQVSKALRELRQP